MKKDILYLIQIVIPVACSLITGFVIPWLRSKIENEKLEYMEKWAIYAVKSAELTFPDKKQGAKKKEFVVKFLNSMFNSKKIVISTEQINILVEYAVKELKEKESNGR
jgi:LL-H family phage holin